MGVVGTSVAILDDWRISVIWCELNQVIEDLGVSLLQDNNIVLIIFNMLGEEFNSFSLIGESVEYFWLESSIV